MDGERAAGRSVGLVPTMGFLHEGHASLVDAAVADNDVTVVSIFVNPLQFAPGEDLADYPRDLAADLEVCALHGADLVFHPTVDEMYPEAGMSAVEVGEVARPLEGARNVIVRRTLASETSDTISSGGSGLLTLVSSSC